MRKKLLLKFMAPTVVVVFVVVALFGVITDYALEAELKNAANTQANDQASSMLAELQTVDALSSAAAGTAMRVLRGEGAKLGVAAVAGTGRLSDKTVPNLLLGRASQLREYALVDRVKALTGSTATLFVKSGEDFVRVSTNVMKPDGSRAIGTVLDPKGVSIRWCATEAHTKAWWTFWASPT